MVALKVHIIHVGNMSNKGTQALLKSDVSVIREILGEVIFFSVSTTDIQGVKRLSLPVEKVLPPIMDIPYEKADKSARKFSFDREHLRYKVFALASLFYMFVQAVFSVISIVFIKVGLHAFYRAEVIKRVKNCDFVVSCSDENFKESASLLPLNPYWVITWWSMLVARTWEILIARSLGKPVIMFPNSVGPFRTWVGKFLSRLSLNSCNYILIREPVSYSTVNGLKVRSHKILTSDTALLFRSRKDVISNNSSHPIIGVSPGIYRSSLSKKEVRNYILAHAKALDMGIERYGVNVVFLPHYVTGFRYDDLEVCELIVQEMKYKERVRIVNMKTVEEFKSFSDQMDMIISSKMHPAILAVSGYVPVICIAYDHKQTSFFDHLDMNDCVISIRDISYEALLSKIDYVWAMRGKIQDLLMERVPILQRDIRMAIKYALASLLSDLEARRGE